MTKSPSDVVAAYTDPAFGAQDLVLMYGGASRTTIKGGAGAIASFEFGNGTTLTPAQLIATNLAPAFARPSNVLIGTAGNDTLTDASGRDVLAYALEGSDVVQTGAGNDVLDGGPGRDILLGGSGNDVYRFSRGDGDDRAGDEDRDEQRVDEHPRDRRGRYRGHPGTVRKNALLTAT
jgi:Ca2+-binding RTX toxin-like protein